jgi:hypothetical protein
MQAVIAEEGDYGIGRCDKMGRIIEHIDFTDKDDKAEKIKGDKL